MNNIHYLDHAATSYPTKYFAKDYYIPANPNSSHALGLQANQALNKARQRIMDCLGVKSGKVLFCRCATEAVEWLCTRFDEQHYASAILCSAYEHDSCYDIVGIGYHNQTPEKFVDIIEDTEYEHTRGLYIHQYINQLTGTVFPIKSIGKEIQSTGAFFGSDFTAAIGHYALPENLDSFCDAVWFSGHKFGCEPGIGAIWLSDRLFKYLGGSEDSRNNYNLLHGTPNVSAAIAMSYAMEHAIEDIPMMQDRWQNLVFHLQRMLNKSGVECELVCNNQPKTYAINALYLPGFNADALVQFLSSKEIYISSGHSACASNEDYRVLEAFGLTKQEASQTVRISFGEDTTKEDIDALVSGIMEFKEMFV